jgi:hypothetical protein
VSIRKLVFALIAITLLSVGSAPCWAAGQSLDPNGATAGQSLDPNG